MKNCPHNWPQKSQRSNISYFESTLKYCSKMWILGPLGDGLRFYFGATPNCCAGALQKRAFILSCHKHSKMISNIELGGGGVKC